MGYICVEDASFELLFAQVRMFMQLMFDILPLSRFNHLVGNCGSKVWSKRIAQTLFLWKQKMTCPMDGPLVPAFYCPIKIWSNKKMFVAHWLIYHSRIVGEHEKDGVPCHYMTDHEADMKQHVSKVHEPKLKSMVTFNLYVKENTWLDLTSSWSIKDIEKRYKTFPEVSYIGSGARLLVWVIRNLKAEDLRGKNNVPVYLSSEWRRMIKWCIFTTKEMNRIDTTSGEDSNLLHRLRLRKREETKESSGQIKGHRGVRSCNVCGVWNLYVLVHPYGSSIAQNICRGKVGKTAQFEDMK